MSELGALSWDPGHYHRTGPALNPVAEKAALRARIRAERKARSRVESREVADALRGVLLEMPEIRAALTIAIYASMRGEPGTAPVRRAMREVGIRVILPVITEDGDLDWAEDDGLTGARAGTEPTRFAEPLGPTLGRAEIATAEVVIVPALAVDTLGVRLGQGRGCYDRALPRVHPSALVLAAVHDDELLDAAVEPLIAEPHDQPVGGVVTPTRWMRLNR